MLINKEKQKLKGNTETKIIRKIKQRRKMGKYIIIFTFFSWCTATLKICGMGKIII